jgi:dsRNA-specific ribonuclease
VAAMMYITFSPVHYNAYSKYAEGTFSDTKIKVVNDNTFEYDGQQVEFPSEEMSWPEIFFNTHGKIHKAYRDENGKIHLTVRVLYTKLCPKIADLQEHEIQEGEGL